MQIKEATEKNIPEILEVLKASLGEISSKKTEEVWRFKHIDNPFGKSLVLIAIENNEIIGVRAFMRWQWQRDERIYNCFRAVDTATHPKHQGKGIFKKLTLEAIERAKEQGNHFIFNTPNLQSLPGYLKMNWEKVDKLNVNIYPTLNFLRSNKNKSNHQIGNNLDGKALQDLCIFNNDNQKQHILFTPKSIDYLTWRYSNNPLQSYEIFTGQGIYLAGYIKNHKYFKELRLSEVIVDKANKKNAGKIIKNWAQNHGAHIVTTAAGIDIFSKVKVSGAFGPVLTIRNLNLDTELYMQLLELENISYTLGDLELF